MKNCTKIHIYLMQMILQKTLETVRKLNEEKSLIQPKSENFDALVDRNLLTNLRDTAKELKVSKRFWWIGYWPICICIVI
jgi:phage antirepressor YoqD-like protein